MSETCIRERTFGEGLNAAQRRAATHAAHDAEPLLVIAGAGTGKTNTLAHRVAHLLLEGVPGERIALLTFTRRAAREMLARARRITAAELRARGRGGHADAVARLPWSGTFHSIANRLLREYAPALGLDPGFSILDRGDAADLLDLVRSECGLAERGKRFPRKDTCLAIYSHRVNTRGSLEDTLQGAFPWCADWHDELKRLFRGYVEAKQRQQVLDYDDLLLYWHVLVDDERAAREIGARFDHILVDEYQDTNTLQAEILLALKPEGRGLTVVGDDAQSIYAFRAATVDNILGFADCFEPPARIVPLERNYRSVQPILDAANALMVESTQTHRKTLHAVRPGGQSPRYVSVEDDQAQAEYVALEILARREQGTRLRRQAVLMRNAHDSDGLELELIRRDIPYVKYGGLKFLEAAHVKDVMALLRFVENPRDRMAAFRTLQLLPGMGPVHAGRCLDWLEGQGGGLAALTAFQAPAGARSEWPEFAKLLTDLAGSRAWAGQMSRVRAWYEPQLERLYGSAHVRAGDLEQLEAQASQYESRERFLSELTLDPPQASGDEAGPPLEDEDYLILSTVHSAKGQEWDSVYVLSVVDGHFPSEFATGDPAQIEEERRLLYVAMTRAREHLELIAPLKFYVTEQRRYGDRHLYGARSRFLTNAVLGCFEARAWPEANGRDGVHEPAVGTAVQIDAGARMKAMWAD